MKTDAERHLVKDVHIQNDKLRRDIIRAIFGVNGLSSVSDTALFNVKVTFY